MKKRLFYVKIMYLSTPIDLEGHFSSVCELPDDSPSPFANVFAIVYFTKHLQIYRFLRFDH